MNGGADEERDPLGRLFPDLVGLDRVRGQRKMGAVLFYGTEGDVDRAGSIQAG